MQRDAVGKAAGLDVVGRHRGGILRQLHRVDHRVRKDVGGEDGEAARAGAEVEHPLDRLEVADQRALGAEQVGAEQQLADEGARDDHPRVDRERHALDIGAADQIGRPAGARHPPSIRPSRWQPLGAGEAGVEPGRDVVDRQVQRFQDEERRLVERGLGAVAIDSGAALKRLTARRSTSRTVRRSSASGVGGAVGHLSPIAARRGGRKAKMTGRPRSSCRCGSVAHLDAADGPAIAFHPHPALGHVADRRLDRLLDSKPGAAAARSSRSARHWRRRPRSWRRRRGRAPRRRRRRHRGNSASAGAGASGDGGGGDQARTGECREACCEGACHGDLLTLRSGIIPPEAFKFMALNLDE